MFPPRFSITWLSVEAPITTGCLVHATVSQVFYVVDRGAIPLQLAALQSGTRHLLHRHWVVVTWHNLGDVSCLIVEATVIFTNHL